jgi:hypothetical protein
MLSYYCAGSDGVFLCLLLIHPTFFFFLVETNIKWRFGRGITYSTGRFVHVKASCQTNMGTKVERETLSSVVAVVHSSEFVYYVPNYGKKNQ